MGKPSGHNCRVVTKTRDGTEPARNVPSRPALLKPGTAGRNSELDCVLNHGTHLKLAAQYNYLYAYVAMRAPGADLGGVHGVHVHPPSAICKVASHTAVNIQF